LFLLYIETMNFQNPHTPKWLNLGLSYPVAYYTLSVSTITLEKLSDMVPPTLKISNGSDLFPGGMS